MAKASQIALRQEFAELDVSGIPIKLFYYPDRFSPHIMRQFSQLLLLVNLGVTKEAKVETEDDLERELLGKVDNLASILATLIASWDLEEDMEACAPGAMVALTAERLAKFGFVFLFTLVQKLFSSLGLLGEAKSARQNGHLSATSGAKARGKR
jgi:hypothetical protein